MPLPTTAVSNEILTAARAMGLAKYDFACMFDVLASMSGVTAAILAVGGIADRVVAVQGQPAVRPMMMLTVSCDHRVADGARAALFLRDLAEAIRNPGRILQ